MYCIFKTRQTLLFSRSGFVSRLTWQWTAPTCWRVSGNTPPAMLSIPSTWCTLVSFPWWSLTTISSPLVTVTISTSTRTTGSSAPTLIVYPKDQYWRRIWRWNISTWVTRASGSTSRGRMPRRWSNGTGVMHEVSFKLLMFGSNDFCTAEKRQAGDILLFFVLLSVTFKTFYSLFIRAF